MSTPPTSTPYPEHLIRECRLRDGAVVVLRPIRPDDAEREARFVRDLSDESRYYRFMDHLRELSPSSLLHLTQIDYHDHMALVAVTLVEEQPLQIGVARYVVDRTAAAESDAHPCAEFAIAIADAWQNRGLGTRLMTHLIDSARERKLALLYSDVISGNRNMVRLMNKLGFTLTHEAGNLALLRAELRLSASAAASKN